LENITHQKVIFMVALLHSFSAFNFFSQLQLLGCLAGVEMILKDVGYPVKLGSGVAAACAYLQNSTPLIASRI
jgi:hypothetical protein